MQTAEVRPEPTFAGSSDEQQIARTIFEAMRGMGRFFSRTAPIRVSVESLAGYLASRQQGRDAAELSTQIQQVLAINADVFDTEEVSGQLLAVTTVDGVAPSRVNRSDTEHTLTQRFQEPAPASQKTWTSRRRPSPIIEQQLIDHIPAPAAESLPVPTAPEVEPQAVEAADEDEELIAEAPAPAPAVVTPVADMSDEELAAALASELRNDVSVANFGDQWMAEDKTPRLSRGDIRRIHDYIVERSEPLPDRALVEDVLSVRPEADSYELTRFGLNYRLSREPKEFEFVGTPDQGLWSTVGLMSIGTTKRKPGEIGQEYRFLLSEPPAELAPGELVVEHVLTFYEYQYGVLPLNGLFKALFPQPLLPDQRAAVLSFEAPQSYETFLVELRYPSGNRGGYLAGFDRFFLENLVPGALITIERNAENDGKYLIEFLPVSGETEKLLQLDDKKNRYVFRPRTFYCATSDEMLLTENRFPQFANAAPLEDRARRRPELTLAATFERIGEQVGTPEEPRFMAMIDDLLPAANVERPMSVELIRSLASSGDHPEFTLDPETADVFYYEPPRA